MNIPSIFYFLPVLVLPSLVLKIRGSLCPLLTGPDMAYLNSMVSFQCKAPDTGVPVTYQLMKATHVLIDTRTDVQGDQPATFHVKASATSEGSYHCTASAGGKTAVSDIIILNVVVPASGTTVTSDPFPPILYEGARLVLRCNVTKGSHLSYTWFFNRTEVTPSSHPWLRHVGNKLTVEAVTPEHVGTYSCMAETRVSDSTRVSTSGEVKVVVKVYFSTPRISFAISKVGAGYRGNVSCWITRGSPPVSFHLLLDEKEVDSVVEAESTVVWFPVAMAPGLDMGVAQCLVKSEVQQLKSEPLTLEVVPVRGKVNVEVEYLYRADLSIAAARLHCHLSRGTFPTFSWLVNNSVLPTEVPSHTTTQLFSPHYAYTNRRQTLVLAKLGPEDFGYYRCRTQDSYDDSSPWLESAAVLVQPTGTFASCKENLPTTTPPNSMVTIEAISIAFCAFLLLILVGGTACMIRMFDSQQGNNMAANTLPVSTIPSLPGRDMMETSCDVLNQTMEST